MMSDLSPSPEMLRAAFAGVPPRRVACPSRWGEAAVLAPLLPTRAGWSLIFTLRPETVSTHKGQMSFPGGRLDPSDASPRAAALREMQEELGIPPSQVQIIGRLTSLPSRSARVLVHPFVGLLLPRPLIQANPAEVAEVVIIPVAELRNPAIHRIERMEIMGRMVTVHFYEWQGYTIWGLTGHLLTELLARWPDVHG